MSDQTIHSANLLINRELRLFSLSGIHRYVNNSTNCHPKRMKPNYIKDPLTFPCRLTPSGPVCSYFDDAEVSIQFAAEKELNVQC